MAGSVGPLLSVAQAAALANTTETQVLRVLESGQLESLTVNGGIRVRRSDVLRLFGSSYDPPRETRDCAGDARQGGAGPASRALSSPGVAGTGREQLPAPGTIPRLPQSIFNMENQR